MRERVFASFFFLRQNFTCNCSFHSKNEWTSFTLSRRYGMHLSVWLAVCVIKSSLPLIKVKNRNKSGSTSSEQKFCCCVALCVFQCVKETKSKCRFITSVAHCQYKTEKVERNNIQNAKSFAIRACVKKNEPNATEGNIRRAKITKQQASSAQTKKLHCCEKKEHFLWISPRVKTWTISVEELFFLASLSCHSLSFWNDGKVDEKKKGKKNHNYDNFICKLYLRIYFTSFVCLQFLVVYSVFTA